MARNNYNAPTFEPTDIVQMICNECGQVYTRKVGLMINGKLSLRESRLVVKPCIGMPLKDVHLNRLDDEHLTQEHMDGIAARLAAKEKCGSVDYIIYRQMKVNAMPIGKRFNDLSRKHA